MNELAINTRVATRCSVPAGTPLLERVCSYCKRTLGWVVCEPESDGARSHGACDPCASREHRRMSEAARYLRSEYTLEVGTGCDEHPTQAATPHGQQGREDNVSAGAVKQNASEALRGPISSSFPAAMGADERCLEAVAPSENAGGGQGLVFNHAASRSGPENKRKTETNSTMGTPETKLTSRELEIAQLELAIEKTSRAEAAARETLAALARRARGRASASRTFRVILILHRHLKPSEGGGS